MYLTLIILSVCTCSGQIHVCRVVYIFVPVLQSEGPEWSTFPFGLYGMMYVCVCVYIWV